VLCLKEKMKHNHKCMKGCVILKMFGGRTGNGNPNLQGMFWFVFVYLIHVFNSCICFIYIYILTYSTFSLLIYNIGIAFGSDCGYWTPSLLFLFLLQCGADVVGTVARYFWYPFTFTKRKATTIEADQRNRIEIRMKGAKDVFYKVQRLEQLAIELAPALLYHLLCQPSIMVLYLI
jgi:hypothetical protein